MEMSERVIWRSSVVTIAAAALAAGCAAGGRGPTHGIAGEGPIVRTCADGAHGRVGSANVAWAAFAVRPTAARRAPRGKVVARFGLRNVNGAPTVFGVLGEQVDRSGLLRQNSWMSEVVIEHESAEAKV